MSKIIQVENLKTYFYVPNGIVKAVNGISFSLTPGEVLGLVGESGSGKSMACRSMLRVVPYPGKIIDGHIYYQGEDILTWPENRFVSFRGSEISMILQEPMTALNPVLSIGEQIIETICQHEHISRKAAKDRAIDLMKLVGMPEPARKLKQYPHEFSGGMRQRAMIAIALSCRPKILLADEPTTALDVTIQDQIIRLIQELQQEFNMSVIWVTHDLGVVAQICHKVAVMYAGSFLELADVTTIFENSHHPYTKSLLESIPKGGSRDLKLIPIEGQPPDLLNMPPGCPFAPRCHYSMTKCSTAEMSLINISSGHYSACIRLSEIWN